MSDVAVAEVAQELPAPELEQEAPQAEAQEENQTDNAEKADDGDNGKSEEVFPKKALNALARKQKKLAKLTDENMYLRQQIMEIKSKLDKPKQDVPPSYENFTSLDEYQAKLAEYHEAKGAEKVKQEMSAEQSAQQMVQWEKQRTAEVENRAEELAKQIPDYAKTVQDDEVLGEIAGLSKELKQLLLMADDPSLAVYHLAKDGGLFELSDMPLAKAAILIGQAQSKGIPQKPVVTKAPEPMKAAAGRGGVATNDLTLPWEKFKEKYGL